MGFWDAFLGGASQGAASGATSGLFSGANAAGTDTFGGGLGMGVDTGSNTDAFFTPAAESSGGDSFLSNLFSGSGGLFSGSNLGTLGAGLLALPGALSTANNNKHLLDLKDKEFQLEKEKLAQQYEMAQKELEFKYAQLNKPDAQAAAALKVAKMKGVSEAYDRLINAVLTGAGLESSALGSAGQMAQAPLLGRR